MTPPRELTGTGTTGGPPATVISTDTARPGNWAAPGPAPPVLRRRAVPDRRLPQRQAGRNAHTLGVHVTDGKISRFETGQA